MFMNLRAKYTTVTAKRSAAKNQDVAKVLVNMRSDKNRSHPHDANHVSFLRLSVIGSKMTNQATYIFSKRKTNDLYLSHVGSQKKKYDDIKKKLGTASLNHGYRTDGHNPA